MSELISEPTSDIQTNIGTATNPMGVTVDTSSSWFSNVYTGSPQALLSAGLIVPDQLRPQEGRRNGKTVFNPDGTPFPIGTARGWRTPGQLVITELDNGSYRVEITVPKEVQKTRLSARREAKRLESEESIDKNALAKALELRHIPLRHDFGLWLEDWQGTKSQLQAAGIGCGLSFPGEEGIGEEVHCKCPLGFHVEISAHYEKSKAMAGIFRAISRYVERQSKSRDFVSYAPGVSQFFDEHRFAINTYVGTAQALVASGLARHDQFPGQPGRGKTRCSYRADGSSANNSKYGWAMTIGRQGKNKFFVELPAPESEMANRERIAAEKKAQEATALATAKDERVRLRRVGQQLRVGPPAIDEFRADKKRDVDLYLRLLWCSITESGKGAFSLEIAKDGNVCERITRAFDSIRAAVQDATVVTDQKLVATIAQRSGIAGAVTGAEAESRLRLVVDNT